MTALYEIANEYRAISDRLHDLDLDEETIADTLESLSGELTEKSTNVAKFVRNLEAMAAQIKEAEAQMAARRKSIEKRAENIRKYLHTNMEKAGITKIECPWFVVSLRTNPASVQIDDEAEIPDEYMREIPAKYEPNKVAIKSSLQEGIAVPGCHLERTTRLEIK